MHDFGETLSQYERVKAKMKEKGIKQVQLAKMLGVSPQHAHKILKHQEKSQYLPKIMECLGMDESLSDSLSKRVKAKIKEMGVKQAHLAKQLGVSPQHLNKILTKDQRKKQYMPQIAKILDMDEFSSPKNRVKFIPILTENNFQALSNRAFCFEEIDNAALKSWPSFLTEEGYCFGYALTQTISSTLLKEDLLIFSTCLPLDMSGCIGIAFIKETQSIFIGSLKYSKKGITLFNEHACIELGQGDLWFGVSIHLERNMKPMRA